MGIGKFSLLVLAILVLLTSGLMAGGFESSGVGTKARGLGGAFRAVADDWSAAYYNPAGYAYILDNQIGAVYSFMHYRNELVPDYKWGGIYETGIYNDRVNYNANEILSNPAGGFVVRLPFWGETVFGLSAYQPFDYNITWELFSPIQAYNDSVGLPGDQFRNNLDVVAFQLTAGREFSEDKLSLGLGLQVLRADLLYTNLYFRDNPLMSMGNPIYDVMQDRPYDKIPEWSRNDGFGWGFGVNAGMLWKLNEKLNVGATVNIPFSITVKGDGENRFYMPKNNTLWKGITYPGTVEHLFLSGQIVRVLSDFEAKLDLPTSLGLGFKYQASEKLTLSLDIDYTLWSKYNGLQFEYTNIQGLSGSADTVALAREFFSTNLSAPVDWENAATFMLGASYDYSSLFTLLGGIGFDQSPARNADQFTPQFIDTGNKTNISLGFIAHIERWDLSLISTYQKQPDLNIEGLDGYNADGVVERFPGDYKAETYETTLSFNYRF